MPPKGNNCPMTDLRENSNFFENFCEILRRNLEELREEKKIDFYFCILFSSFSLTHD
jgi:hypothetical protein